MANQVHVAYRKHHRYLNMQLKAQVREIAKLERSMEREGIELPKKRKKQSAKKQKAVKAQPEAASVSDIENRTVVKKTRKAKQAPAAAETETQTGTSTEVLARKKQRAAELAAE